MTEIPLNDRPHTLYRMFSASGRLLYIGITANAYTRWSAHAWDKPWWPEVSDTKLEHHPNRAAALAAEAAAIKAERPAYNVQHNSRPAKRSPLPAVSKQTYVLPDDLDTQYTVALVDDKGSPMSVSLRWASINGKPVCTGFSMATGKMPDTDYPHAEEMPEIGTPIEAGLLRRFSIIEHIGKQRGVLMEQLADQVITRESMVRMRRATRARLEEAAAVYREAFARGDKPTLAVAEHFGLSSGGASNLVSRARAAGLLPPTSPGGAQG